ncbi:isopentenyl-diphosphate delta-isomerase [Trifolium medium]|uniref:Isopentenyl-diphosphate delta-isomerase n=1 Tax=Trifolium medium TaxID=97028 RepID=A0A392P3F0_9FABA|nr:isopentenyl-diphosphate delta-isomerase [Trifolium medium]
MAQSSIVATLSRQVFKRNITSTLFAHTYSSFRSSSLFFNRKIHLSASLSSQTAMGETPVAVDAGMDAVQRRLMFDDEYVSLSFSISSTPFRSICCLCVSLIYVRFVELG